MTPSRILLLVVAVTLLLAWAFRWDPWLVTIAGIGGAIAFLNARDWEAFGRHPFDLPSTAPRISTAHPDSIDLGDIRVRRVDAPDPDAALARARESARAVDPTAPRIVLAVPGVAEVDGRATRVVIYEAAERRFRERTLAFIQPCRLGRLRFPATVQEDLHYVGDAQHTLRFVGRG